MFNIIYKNELLDTADTKEEAEYITAEYNCAFKEKGAVKYEKVEEGGAFLSPDEVATREFDKRSIHS